MFLKRSKEQQYHPRASFLWGVIAGSTVAAFVVILLHRLTGNGSAQDRSINQRTNQNEEVIETGGLYQTRVSTDPANDDTAATTANHVNSEEADEDDEDEANAHVERTIERPKFACDDLMGSSDEELLDGDAYYGTEDEDDSPQAEAVAVVCRQQYAAQRPCELSLEVGDTVMVFRQEILKFVQCTQNQRNTLPKWCLVVKQYPSSHAGLVPYETLAIDDNVHTKLLNSPQPICALPDEAFSECKQNANCHHERVKRRIIDGKDGARCEVGGAVIE